MHLDVLMGLWLVMKKKLFYEQSHAKHFTVITAFNPHNKHIMLVMI